MSEGTVTMNPYGYIDIPVTAEMVETSKRRAVDGDVTGGTDRSRLDERWHGHLGEGVVRAIYAAHGIGVSWDGGCNGQPDLAFQCDGFTADVKTFRIAKGPFLPSYSIAVLPEAFEKPITPSGLVFAVYDEGAQLLTVLGTCPTGAFQRWATLIRAGDPLPAGPPSKADALLLPARRLNPMSDHVSLRLKVQSEDPFFSIACCAPTQQRGSK